MWDASLVIPNYIAPPHPALIETSEIFCKCTFIFVKSRVWWIFFFFVLLEPGLLRCLIGLVLEGYQSCSEYGLATGAEIWRAAEFFFEDAHFSDNACEAIKKKVYTTWQTGLDSTYYKWSNLDLWYTEQELINILNIIYTSEFIIKSNLSDSSENMF